MRFYLDEDHSDEIAAAARRRGVDITCSHETGRDSWTDLRLLEQAGEEGRCVITRNYSDFALLTREFEEQGLSHAGVVFVPRSLRSNDFGAVAAAIVRFDQQHADGVPPYSTWWLRATGNRLGHRRAVGKSQIRRHRTRSLLSRLLPVALSPERG